MPARAMSVGKVAAYLNVNEKTVYRLSQRGELPGFKIAGTWRFKPSDLEEWIDLQKKRPMQISGSGLPKKQSVRTP